MPVMPSRASHTQYPSLLPGKQSRGSGGKLIKVFLLIKASIKLKTLFLYLNYR